jgi:hypothetical protein
VFDVSTALTVMELGVGGNSGAVYIPLLPMVPKVAFPPAIPLIDQLTAGFDPSPVFALNCCCVTPGMDAPDGVTVNAVSPGPPAAPGSPGRIAWAHPPSNTTNAVSITSAERFTASPLSLRSLMAAHSPDFNCVGRFKLRRDWFWENTGVDRLALLTARPDSEQLVRCPSKFRIVLLIMIMGRVVQGGDIYGTLPTFAFGGPGDFDKNGRWIHTTSIDQSGASLAAWFGVQPASLPAILPNLANFMTPTLSFLG